MIEIIYNIKATNENGKTENIDFKQFYENDECTDAYSFNPTSDWTGYTQFTDGWSEQDPELNELLAAIKDYSTSMELNYLIADSEIEDIGKKYEVTYYCEGYIEENKEYQFTVEIIYVSEDIEEE